MTDEQEQADASNDTPVEIPSDESEAVEAASESVEELRSRITELESRRTKEGRSAKETRDAKDALETQLAAREDVLAKKEAELEKWNVWWIQQNGTPAQKAGLLTRQQQKSTPSNANETETWRAIAEEENPQVKKVLLGTAKTGDFLTKKQIASLRASFEDEEVGATPPKVKPVRTTGATETTLEQRLVNAKKANNASEVLRISSQIAARNAKRS